MFELLVTVTMVFILREILPMILNTPLDGPLVYIQLVIRGRML